MVSGISGQTNTETFFKTLGQLRFWDGMRWQTLPPWALFYIELGATLGLLPASKGTRTVLALAVPSRSYTAALIAAGSILARAVLFHKPEPPEEHIAWLLQLAVDTPVLVRSNNRRRNGKFKGIVHSNGHTYYKAQTDSGSNTTFYCQPDDIQPLDKEEIALPKTQKGRVRQEIAPLVTRILDKAASPFSRQTQLDCILVGTISILREETEHQQLAITTGNYQYETGTLRDLIRPKRFLPANSAYRSRVLASSSKRKVSLARETSPHVVILDGSLSYLDQHQAWRSNCMVCILDQTEPQFGAAVDEINHTYYRRSNTDVQNIKLPPVPAGVEAMLFKVDL